MFLTMETKDLFFDCHCFLNDIHMLLGMHQKNTKYYILTTKKFRTFISSVNFLQISVWEVPSVCCDWFIGSSAKKICNFSWCWLSLFVYEIDQFTVFQWMLMLLEGVKWQLGASVHWEREYFCIKYADKKEL